MISIHLYALRNPRLRRSVLEVLQKAKQTLIFMTYPQGCDIAQLAGRLDNVSAMHMHASRANLDRSSLIIFPPKTMRIAPAISPRERRTDSLCISQSLHAGDQEPISFFLYGERLLGHS